MPVLVQTCSAHRVDAIHNHFETVDGNLLVILVIGGFVCRTATEEFNHPGIGMAVDQNILVVINSGEEFFFFKESCQLNMLRVFGNTVDLVELFGKSAVFHPQNLVTSSFVTPFGHISSPITPIEHHLICKRGNLFIFNAL